MSCLHVPSAPVLNECVVGKCQGCRQTRTMVRRSARDPWFCVKCWGKRNSRAELLLQDDDTRPCTRCGDQRHLQKRGSGAWTCAACWMKPPIDVGARSIFAPPREDVSLIVRPPRSKFKAKRRSSLFELPAVLRRSLLGRTEAPKKAPQSAPAVPRPKADVPLPPSDVPLPPSCGSQVGASNEGAPRPLRSLPPLFRPAHVGACRRPELVQVAAAPSAHWGARPRAWGDDVQAEALGLRAAALGHTAEVPSLLARRSPEWKKLSPIEMGKVGVSPR